MAEDFETTVELGDSRKKCVTIVTGTGERVDHQNIYLRHSTAAFIISSDDSFPESDTSRYSKDEIARVEVSQHHTRCFITTATIGEGAELNLLREFRDDTLTRSVPGRALIALYEMVSPPIARTLATHPNAQTSRTVRWLVIYCTKLARHRSAMASPSKRFTLSVLLTVVYIVGVCLAAIGHLGIRLREWNRSASLQD
jgi:hypothetical protein